MSIVAHNTLNQAIDNKKIKPSDILNHVHLSISNTLHQTENKEIEDGMDISICLLDTDTNELQFAGAYHPLYIVRDEGLKIIKSDKFSIGSQKGKGKTYSSHNLKLMKGDTIYIFSDGFADQFGGPKEKKFMYKRLKNLILEVQSETMINQKKIINTTFLKWKGELEQVDDVCLMGVKI